jgi:PP-loop superfamily ATP-utilizing enzyme
MLAYILLPYVLQGEREHDKPHSKLIVVSAWFVVCNTMNVPRKLTVHWKEKCNYVKNKTHQPIVL